MNDSIKHVSNTIAHRLVLQEKAVKKWVKSNKYDLLQLNTIARQIHNNDIYLPTLVSAITYNRKYRISVY
jgi:hypothetical protein